VWLHRRRPPAHGLVAGRRLEAACRCAGRPAPFRPGETYVRHRASCSERSPSRCRQEPLSQPSRAARGRRGEPAWCSGTYRCSGPPGLPQAVVTAQDERARSRRNIHDGAAAMCPCGEAARRPESRLERPCSCRDDTR
jgi:hypothetical protein